jgi:hypothetical protein
VTLATRIDKLEDGLPPREAMTLWMKEAHSFGSFVAHARWLIDQPEEVYPLVRMPAQVVAHVRAQRKGTADHLLRDEFYRAQKDVVFLYFLHKQVNLKFLLDQEALQLRVVLLIRRLGILIHEQYDRDDMRLKRLGLEGTRNRKPGKAEQKLTLRYREHVEEWPKEARDLLSRLLVFHEAVRILSNRYLYSADLLFPEARESLEWNLETIAKLKEQYVDGILGGVPEGDKEFRLWVLALEDERPEENEDDLPELPDWPPDLSGPARDLAQTIISQAKAEALEKLGEHRAAEELSARLVRERLG